MENEAKADRVFGGNVKMTAAARRREEAREAGLRGPEETRRTGAARERKHLENVSGMASMGFGVDVKRMEMVKGVLVEKGMIWDGRGRR